MKHLFISMILVATLCMNASYAVQSGIVPNKTLHQAARDGDITNAKLLISNGANVNQMVDGFTPLHTSAELGHKDIVELLISSGANVNTKANAGWTPLHLAATAGRQEIVTLLIAKRADVNALDENSKTPIWWAKVKGHKQIVELLKRNGAKEGAPTPPQQNYVDPNTRRPNTTIEVQQQKKPDIDLNSIANIDPLKEPNAVKKRLEMFQDLDQEMKNIEQQSDTEITEWINGLEDITPDIVKAVYENIGAEYEFVRKQAEEEKANKTTTVIDGVMLYRSERFGKVVEKLQEEEIRREMLESRSRRGGGSRRSTRGRTGTRDGGYNNYNDGRRYQGTTRRTGRRRTRDEMTSRPTPTKVTIKLPFTDPNTVKAKIKTYEGLEKELKAVDRLGIREMRGWVTKQGTSSPMLAKAVYQQVSAELNFARKIAIEEKAAKTTVVIDGLIVNRNDRLDKLSKRMVEEKRKLRREEPRTSRTRIRR